LDKYDHRFPGQVADSETGLYYNYFRDYDPEIGRYVESDPIGLEGGTNTYGYVGANPTLNADPTGLASTVPRLCLNGFCPPPPPPNLVDPVTGQPWASVVDEGDGRSRERESSSAARSRNDDYHSICDQREPPGLDKCQSAKFRLQRAQQCYAARESYANKYFGGKYDAGHAKQMQDLQKAIKNAEKDVKKNCLCK
jgi:RHS repeat-associated protein